MTRSTDKSPDEGQLQPSTKSDELWNVLGHSSQVPSGSGTVLLTSLSDATGEILQKLRTASGTTPTVDSLRANKAVLSTYHGKRLELAGSLELLELVYQRAKANITMHDTMLAMLGDASAPIATKEFEDAIVKAMEERSESMVHPSQTTPGLMFKHDTDRAQWDMGVRDTGIDDVEVPDKFHPHLRVLLWTAVGYARAKGWASNAIVVTSLWREGDSGVHGHGRGCDLRMAEDHEGRSRGTVGGLSLRQTEELDGYLGKVFPPYRGWTDTYHDCCITKPHGTGPHLHLQVSAGLGLFSRNRQMAAHDTVKSTSEEVVTMQGD